MPVRVVLELVLYTALSQHSQTVSFARTHLGATDVVACGGSIYQRLCARYSPQTNIDSR